MKRAWSLFRSRVPGFLLLFLGWAGVWGVVEILVVKSGTGPGKPLWILLHLGYFWGTSYWEAAGLRYALESVRGNHLSVWRVFPGHATALRFLGLKAVLLPATLIGTVLLILPGSWVAARYGFSAFILVDRTCSAGEALGCSRRWTAGRTGRLMLLSLRVLLLNLAGAAVLGIGLLISVPVSLLTVAAVFHELVEPGHEGEL